MGEEPRKAKLMVAIDESMSSYYALKWVLQNLKESINASGNPLYIFMVQPPSPISLSVFNASVAHARLPCPILTNTEYSNSFQDQMVSKGILEKAKNICAIHGVKAETMAEAGDPKQAICNAVKKHNISLLVLGDPEVGKIRRALLGNSSSHYVDNASCSVLVVKKPE
ncbi:uncharacterized protein LOC127796497 [Diospyros lotus]|uniref:uncharacterized protein LOC127796497 n=1 Tax=Diospyros lotus TaxID=55363 RepID=UPI00225008C8|nr:uncharacterized protein LOC127796497 [Diospyros lotus]